MIKATPHYLTQLDKSHLVKKTKH